MSKRNKRPVSLGAAVALSVFVSIVVAVAYFLVSLLFPNSPEVLLIEYVRGNQSLDMTRGVLYHNLWAQVSTQQMFVQMPLSMLAAGLVLGRRIGDEYGIRKLYSWAAGCGTFIFVASEVFYWGGILVQQNMRLLPGELAPEVILANILAFILWVGLYVCGADIGRRFYKTRTPRTATA